MINRYCLYISTIQTSSFKSIIECLKSELTDVNFTFTAPTKTDPGGITMFSNDKHINSLAVYMQLPATSFDVFVCKPEKLKAGINMQTLHKIIKTMTSDDILTLSIEDTDQNTLIISIETKLYVSTHKLKLLDLYDDNKMDMRIDCSCVITINAQILHKIIKDMSSLADKFELKLINVNNNADKKHILTLNFSADFSSHEIKFDTSENLKVNNIKNDSIISGTYDLKQMLSFSKCSSYCNNIDIHMANNEPLILRYQIANLGNVFIFLPPLNDVFAEPNNDIQPFVGTTSTALNDSYIEIENY